ncbi:MAG TPA: hypothetical protein VMI31_17930, partial [Fimbriimonadaceae bacterium]|nr:hypothetical protein [Fimbriimonadaceae bacterium]
MANRQQPPRQNVWQTVLLFSVLYLATMLMCNRQQQAPTDPRTATEILGDVNNPASGEPPPPPKVQGATYDTSKGSMYWANSTLNWSTLTAINKLYQDRLSLDEDNSTKNLKGAAKTQAEQEWKARLDVEKLRGDVLIADAEYKYALTHDVD